MKGKKSNKTAKNIAKKVKSKIPSKVRKSISFIAVVCVAVFVLICYFNPSFYQSVINFITGKEERSLVVEIKGDTATVDVLYDLEVHFIDVGQGDSIFFLLPDGRSVLIDAGDNSSYEEGSYSYNMVKYIENRLLNGSKTIDYLIATHTDADHIGGMSAIFNNFEVKKVFRPYVKYNGSAFTFDEEFNKGAQSFQCSTKTYGTFLNLILNERYGKDNTPCEYEYFNYQSDFGMNIVCGETKTKYTFDFLTPTVSIDKIDYENANDFSPYIKFSYQGYSIMLTGDAELEVIDELLTSYKNDLNYLDVDFLKVGHHGSSNATTESLITALKPEYAVILYGEGNKYGHPHIETKGILDAHGVIYNRECGKNRMLSINSLGSCGGLKETSV